MTTLLTLTPQASTASVLVQVNTLTNKISNPSVETNTTGWATVTGTGGVVTTTRETDGGYAGTCRRKTAWTTASTSGGGQSTDTATAALAAGNVVSAGIYVRPSVQRTMRLSITWKDNIGATLSTVNGADTVCAAGVWTRLTLVNQTAPASTDRATITAAAIATEGWAIGTTLDCDSAMVVVNSTLPTYFDTVWPAAGAVTIQRTDVNGTNLVRLLDGQEPISGVMTVTDYECALIGTLSYDVTDSAGYVVTDTTTLAGSVTLPWFNVARLPQSNLELLSVQGYNSTRRSFATVHEAVNRPDPVVVTGRLHYRRGTVELLTGSYTDARTIENTFDLGEILMLRQVDFTGMDMYFVPDTVTVSPHQTTITQRWKVEVSYVEVAAPTGVLLGALGWNFDALLDQYSSFVEVRSSFATFADLTAGP